MQISDRTLLRWLQTGKPRRVTRRLDEPRISERLEAMTRLSPAQVEALTEVLAPPEGLGPGLVDRLFGHDDSEALGVIVDLCGLGWYTASAILESDDHTDGS